MLARDPATTQLPHLASHLAQEDSVNSFRVSAPGTPPSEEIPTGSQQRTSATAAGVPRPPFLNPTMITGDNSSKDGGGTPPTGPVSTNPATTSPPLHTVPSHAMHPSAVATTINPPSAPSHYPGHSFASVHSPTTFVAPNVTEADFHHTRQYIPHVSHPALVAVVQSMLDEAPQLTHVIRAKCENAVASLAATLAVQSPLAPGGSPAVGPFHYSPTPPGHAQPFMPQYHPHPGPVEAGPQPNAQGNNRHKDTPATSNQRQMPSRPRRIEEEYEMCQVHGNLRATKHLTFNHSTQQVECISGFHCLESAPNHGEKTSPLANQSPKVETSKNGSTPTSGGPSGAFNVHAPAFKPPKHVSPRSESSGSAAQPNHIPAAAPSLLGFTNSNPSEIDSETHEGFVDMRRLENILEKLKNQ